MILLFSRVLKQLKIEFAEKAIIIFRKGIKNGIQWYVRFIPKSIIWTAKYLPVIISYYTQNLCAIKILNLFPKFLLPFHCPFPCCAIMWVSKKKKQMYLVFGKIFGKTSQTETHSKLKFWILSFLKVWTTFLLGNTDISSKTKKNRDIILKNSPEGKLKAEMTLHIRKSNFKILQWKFYSTPNIPCHIWHPKSYSGKFKDSIF